MKIQTKILLLVFFAIVSGLQAQKPLVNIIPEPASVTVKKGQFTLVGQMQIVNQFAGATAEAALLQKLIQQKTGLALPIKTSGKGAIHLKRDTSLKHTEAYQLNIDKKGITIAAATTKGVFYGIKTLAQLFPLAVADGATTALPCLTIADEPRFEYRALMLDPARHFLPIADLKKYIAVMAGYKFNYLHLHLSDDQGWRWQVNQYPKLTTIGSKRKETDGNGVPHEGFYTQQELKDLVAYAKTQHIEIIPEIDMPGHGLSVLAAYPELACVPQNFEVATTPGVSKELLCAGKESVYEFYEKVIGELAAIFPNPRLHLGGDEAPLDRWKESPDCQKAIQAHGLKDEEELMAHFFDRINTILQKHGKEPLLWYESTVESYPENSTVYLWRSEEPDVKMREIKTHGLKMVNAYGGNAYFDYPQWKGDGPHTSWMPILPLRQVYDFDPVRGLPNGENDFVIGIEATIWGEYVPNIDRAFYMTFPRALALIEAGWSMPEKRSWERFKAKLDQQLLLLMKKGVHFRPPVELSEQYIWE